MTDDSKRIGKRVDRAIKESGISQTKVAEKAEMSKKHLKKIKDGSARPSIRALARIGHVIGKKLSDLKKRNKNNDKEGGK